MFCKKNTCGYLNESSLHGLSSLNEFLAQLAAMLSRFGRCDLAGGNMSLEAGFESIKTSAISSLLSLFSACGSRYKLTV